MTKFVLHGGYPVNRRIPTPQGVAGFRTPRLGSAQAWLARFTRSTSSVKLHDRGRAFFAELIRDFSEPKVVECLFARPENEWADAFAKDKDFVDENFSDKGVDFRLAQFGTFIEQLAWADVIYFRGGDTKTLINRMNGMGNWRNMLDGKTVAGSSAGAHMLAKYYYGLHSLEAEEGFGVVPVKVIAHYRSDFNAPNIDWDKAYEELKNFKESLPVLALPEGQFETMTL